MFAQGSRAIYVELSDATSRKRYLLPDEATTIPKLQALLRKHPSVHLVRNGTANVTGAPDKSELDSISELEGLPAKVDHLQKVHMPDHPDTPDNFARYSADLVRLINEETEVSTVETGTASAPSLTDQFRSQITSQESSAMSVPSKPQAPSLGGLTDSLRQQMADKKSSTSRPLAPASPASAQSAPQLVDHLPRRLGEVVHAQDSEEEVEDHETYVERFVEEIYDVVQDIANTVRNVDAKVDAIGIRLVAPQQGDAITGEQLSKWFAEAAAKVGFDKAFDELALRIQGDGAKS